MPLFVLLWILAVLGFACISLGINARRKEAEALAAARERQLKFILEELTKAQAALKAVNDKQVEGYYNSLATQVAFEKKYWKDRGVTLPGWCGILCHMGHTAMGRFYNYGAGMAREQVLKLAACAIACLQDLDERIPNADEAVEGPADVGQ